MLSQNGQRPVTIEQFVNGCMKIRGPARSVDLVVVIELLHFMDESLSNFMHYCRAQFDNLITRSPSSDFGIWAKMSEQRYGPNGETCMLVSEHARTWNTSCVWHRDALTMMDELLFCSNALMTILTAYGLGPLGCRLDSWAHRVFCYVKCWW